MKLSKLALAGAVAGLLSAGTAFAQNGWGQPTVSRTAYEYSNYYSQGDAPPQQPATMTGTSCDGAAPSCAVAPSCDSCNSCDSCGTSCCGGLLNPCCCLGEQWKLFDNECLACKGITVQGYIAQSFTWNPSNPADRFNGPVTWTDRSNEYQLNQAYLWAEKATDTGGCGSDIGWRIDILAGTDNRFTTASGLETRGNFNSPKWSTQRFYGVALPQFYVEVALNDWKIKVGHWYAPVGYEVVMTNANFFPNLPYTFQYGEPFTMTGALATYAYSDKVSIVGGIMHGWDNFDNSNPNMSFIGGYTEKFNDDASLALAWTAGNEQTLTGTFRQRILQTAAYSRPLKNISDKLTYVAQSDFGWQNDALLSGADAKWYGLNQYLFYKKSECLSYGIRAEWFRDQGGYRVGGFLGPVDGLGGTGPERGLSTSRFGYDGSFYEVTMGAQYKYSANTTIRPYVRFDWFSGDTTAANGGNLLPFDDGTGNSQTLIGLDVITLF